MRDSAEHAFVLHTRAYRETSLIVEFFTLEQGRVSAVARSARGPRSRFRGQLQAFSPLSIAWVGRQDLMTLTQAELNAAVYPLKGHYLLSALYLNELLMRLLQGVEAMPELFHHYQTTLAKLSRGVSLEPTLRLFEKQLLLSLGYGLQLDSEAQSDSPILKEAYYFFDIQQGPIRVNGAKAGEKTVVQGASLLALHDDNLVTREQLHDAKIIMRIALASLLGNKPLNSRELF